MSAHTQVPIRGTHLRMVIGCARLRMIPFGKTSIFHRERSHYAAKTCLQICQNLLSIRRKGQMCPRFLYSGTYGFFWQLRDLDGPILRMRRPHIDALSAPPIQIARQGIHHPSGSLRLREPSHFIGQKVHDARAMTRCRGKRAVKPKIPSIL